MNAAGIIGGLALPLAWYFVPPERPVPTSVHVVGYLFLTLVGIFVGMIVVVLFRLVHDLAARRQ